MNKNYNVLKTIDGDGCIRTLIVNENNKMIYMSKSDLDIEKIKDTINMFIIKKEDHITILECKDNKVKEIKNQNEILGLDSYDKYNKVDLRDEYRYEIGSFNGLKKIIDVITNRTLISDCVEISSIDKNGLTLITNVTIDDRPFRKYDDEGDYYYPGEIPQDCDYADYDHRLWYVILDHTCTEITNIIDNIPKRDTDGNLIVPYDSLNYDGMKRIKQLPSENVTGQK